VWIDSQEIIMEHALQYKIKERVTEENPTTYGMSAPFEVATGYTASR